MNLALTMKTTAAVHHANIVDCYKLTTVRQANLLFQRYHKVISI